MDGAAAMIERGTMSDAASSLMLDFLEWVAARPRSYDDVMDAWRTHCPRFSIWEDALDAGLVVRAHHAGAASGVELTVQGERLLATGGRANGLDGTSAMRPDADGDAA